MTSHYQTAKLSRSQLENGMARKESDFDLAIAARDEAMKEKEAALAQVEAVKVCLFLATVVAAAQPYVGACCCEQFCCFKTKFIEVV